jgi:hypothetical protein
MAGLLDTPARGTTGGLSGVLAAVGLLAGTVSRSMRLGTRGVEE